jgi:hypothetical protein
MFFKKSLAFCALSALILAGCGTSITIQVQKIPVMNTGGIKSITIQPFESGSNAALNKEMAQYITSIATNNLRNGNYFTLIDFSEYQRLQKSGQNIADNIDGIFTGQIINISSKDSTYTEEKTDPKTEEKYQVTFYLREVEINFSYRFIRTRDGSITNILTKHGRTSDTKEDRQNLSSVNRLLQNVISKELGQLARETAPYFANESRSLMDETSKDKDLKALIKAVSADVKKGNYNQALEQYRSIYYSSGSFAAAYNVTIMYEALKDLPGAINFMIEVYNKTGNPKASARLASLNKSLMEQQSLLTEYAGSQRDKVINYAVEEIFKVLPIGSKVWVFNNAKEELTLSATMVDGITAGLQKKAIIIVDRDNAKLTEAEQKFQASGNVSDKDFVSIGKSAGANILVTVAVTGVGSQRRLQLRVVDIEKSTNRYQSDTSDNWRL